jgi:nicotinamidase-related amidase
MAALSNILDFKEHFQPATLVLVDLDGDAGSVEKADLDAAGFSLALERCRMALGFARRAGLPVAFVRHKPLQALFLSTHTYPSWLHGFRPYRSDMIFERALPSCYASMEFADMARRNGELILAGIFGETSCLSTLIEAHSRNHQFTFLADASASRGRDGVSGETMHHSVVGIASLYSEVLATDAWIDRTSRKIGAVG